MQKRCENCLHSERLVKSIIADTHAESFDIQDDYRCNNKDSCRFGDVIAKPEIIGCHGANWEKRSSGTPQRLVQAYY